MNTTILGSGVAAWTLVRELRKADPEHVIRVITQDNGDFYSKPMLSNALASGKTPTTLVMNAGEKLAEQQNAELFAHTTVEGIDVNDKRLKTTAGEFEFDQLVLCLGASTIDLPIEGSGANSVISVNDLNDYAIFREKIEGKKNIALLGAGLIGCEFANDLRKGGFEVTVYDLADRALPKLLPNEGSEYLQTQLGNQGVQWKLGRTVKTIETEGSGLSITDSEGETLTADVVLSAVGLRPRTELAQAAGLKTDRGIVVNELGQTSCNTIYALGDCAEYFGQHVLPYIMPVMQGARAMAKTLAGEPTPIRFPAMPVTVKTPDCPTVVSPPLPGQAGQWEVECTDEGVKGLFKAQDGTLLGMALMGAFSKERQAYSGQLPAIG